MRQFFAIVCLIAGSNFLCEATAQTDADSVSMSEWISQYTADVESLNHKYRFPMSTARHDRMAEFFTEWQTRLGRANFEKLSQSGKVDYILLKNRLNYEQQQLKISNARKKEIAEIIPFWKSIVQLGEAQEDIKKIDAEQTAVKLNELDEAIKKAMKSISRLKVKQTTAYRAANELSRLRGALSRWHQFYDGYDPLYSWWNKQPFDAVNRSMQKYETQIRTNLVGVPASDKETIIGEPIGDKALLNELKYEMIPYSPAELIEIANEQFKWCDAEMDKAAKELGFEDWRKAQDAVKKKHVKPGEQPQMIKDLAFEAVRFLKANDLVSVPPLAEETWRMVMMTPERQRVSPYFLGGPTIYVSFPTDSMTHEEKLTSMRGNNIHFSRATVHHELIPGHHLQGFMVRRYKPYRQLFRTPFWMEGWALYWEMLLWDLDFHHSPEDRIGMLFWRKHRCARIIFSLSYHLERMTPEECVDFLVNRVGHDRKNAEAEVRRSVMGGYGPLYQAAYMLGGLQIRAMHKELVQSGKMTNRKFHDAILRENSIPIEMLRATLTKQKLTPDFKSSWRFNDNQ